MHFKKALILSFTLHALLIGALSSGISFTMRPEHKLTALEAKLMFKNKPRAPDLLPRKPSPMPKASLPALPQAVPKNMPALAQKIPEKKIAEKIKPKADYAKELARLTQNFAQELAFDAKESPPEKFELELEDDGSYFDQIYLLIKKSFVLPPNLNGPQGHNLQAILRLFLLSDGSLARLILEKSSGDELFDKAVLDGTRRVNNFGSVPLVLQAALKDSGVLIEMCPFKCPSERDS